MAICPFAVHELITSDSVGRGHTPVRMTLHTAVSSAVDLYKGKPASNGTYAHFYVNKAGVIYQYKDTAIAARADAQGNSGSISVETWDGGREQEWNAAQVASLAKLFAWLRQTHPTIPNRLATVKDLRGLAWHRLGCKGNFGAYSDSDITTWSGNQSGAVWSNSRGKTCPYDVRIRQIPTILKASAGTTTTITTTSTQEEDMTPEEHNLLSWIYTNLKVPNYPFGFPQATHNAIGALTGKVDALTTAVAQLAGGGKIDMDAITAAAEKGAKEGAAAITAEDVAAQLEVKAK